MLPCRENAVAPAFGAETRTGRKLDIGRVELVRVADVADALDRRLDDELNSHVYSKLKGVAPLGVGTDRAKLSRSSAAASVRGVLKRGNVAHFDRSCTPRSATRSGHGSVRARGKD